MTPHRRTTGRGAVDQNEDGMDRTVRNEALSRDFREELTGNILPFWMTHVVDEERGVLHGAVGNDLRPVGGAPRSAVLIARVLWTFAAAHRRFGNPAYLAMANRTLDELSRDFWDPVYGGLYWQIDRTGRPVSDRKHHYAQAFGIYGLSEHHRTTGDPRSLDLARELFRKLEEHAFDRSGGGYIEGSARDWRPLEDRRLGPADLDAPKSMNTMLHMIEAYTNLLRAWHDRTLAAQLGGLIRVFIEQIVDVRTGHLGLFFDEQWRPLTESVSFGHDIEASWLLCEATDALDDRPLRESARRISLRLADAVHRDGLGPKGSILADVSPVTPTDPLQQWWPQAEAIVGFYNAFQLTGDERFERTALRCWTYVKDHFVDREGGDWFKRLGPNGLPEPGGLKAGPWDCPYHHGRMCLEMIARLTERSQE